MVMYDKAYDKANGKNSDIKKKITHEIASINMPPLSVNKLLILTSILINSPEINELPILSPLHTHLNSN